MEQQNKIIGLVGRKGSGKSTMAARIMKRASRLFVFDTMGEHSWVPNTFHDVDEADRFLAWGDTQEAFAGRFIPENDLEGDFAELATLSYEQGDMLFAVEEIPLLCSAGYLSPELGKVVRLGRHKDLSLLWTAQRAAEVSRTLTAMTDVFVLFSATEPRDLQAIADRCGTEIADQIARLPLHGYVVFDVIERQELDPGAVSSLLMAGAGERAGE